MPSLTGLNRGRLAVTVIAATMSMAALTSCAPAASESQTTVSIAAASDLKFALDAITEQVEAQHPELDLRVTYGSSGQFAQQIRNGAPFDVYLSADAGYVEALVDEGLARPDDSFPYAVGRLVTWYPQADRSGTGLAGLAGPVIRRIAIANPRHAPYGRAAVAALESAGLAEVVAAKLVLGENVAQAAEFARTGNADAAVIALSLVLAGPLQGIGTFSEVPLDTYPRLDQAGVLLDGSAGDDATRLVRDFIVGDEGRSILRDFGFFMPGEGR